MENLYAALATARANFPPIPRDRTVTVKTKSGGSYSFAYAPLDTILACVTPPLSEQGIALTQDIRDNRIVTILSRGTEQIALAPVPTGIRESMSPQEIGSCLTYAQRYSLKVALVLATEEDDDGNGASGNAWTAQERPMARQGTGTATNALADSLRAAKSLAELSATWADLSKEERLELATVKDAVKERLTLAAAAAQVAAQVEQDVAAEQQQGAGAEE
jgi:hypothetical protein